MSPFLGFTTVSRYLGVPREAFSGGILDDLRTTVSRDQLLVLVEDQKRGQGRDTQQLRRCGTGLTRIRDGEPGHVTHVPERFPGSERAWHG